MASTIFTENQKKLGQAGGSLPPPGPEGIFVPQQGQELLRRKFPADPGAQSPGESPLGEPLVAKPKPLPVIAKDTQRATPPVDKNKQGSSKGIALQFLSAYGAEPVDALPEIHRRHCGEYAHVCSDLDHDQNPFKSSPADGGAPVAVRRNRLPSARIHSICHWTGREEPTSSCMN